MGMKFTKVPETLFNTLQPNAGVLLSTFDPENPPSAAEMIKNIKGATSGGINFTATPEYTDQGEGIDNCPRGMMELMELSNWEITMSGTYLTATAASVKELVGAADVNGEKITPRGTISAEDFGDLWWVGDYSDKNGETNGGFMAIHMMHALNTTGFQIQTSDREKGQMSFSYRAHYSINAQDTVPFEIYIHAGTDEAAAASNEG